MSYTVLPGEVFMKSLYGRLPVVDFLWASQEPKLTQEGILSGTTVHLPGMD